MILTNHLENYGGSEIQVLELYQYCLRMQYGVKVFANYIEDPIKSHFNQEDLILNIDDANLEDFQIIWSQHCIFSRLFKNKVYENLTIKIFSVHLSPFEPFEHSSLAYMSHLDVKFIANSEETKNKLLEFGLHDDKIFVSYNSASKNYQPTTNDQRPTTNNIGLCLIVSNHLPQELLDASKLLRKEGIQVRHIGLKGKQTLISPEIIKQADCIISIGKTVQYAILGNKAIYCYDHFGGPGYLNKENYQIAKYHNFSGRGFSIHKTAEDIAKEIKSGFIDSVNFIKNLTDKEDYIFEQFMDKMLALPNVSISTEQQQYIRRSYPIEELIAREYTSNKILQTRRRRDKQIIKSLIVAMTIIALLLIILIIK